MYLRRTFVTVYVLEDGGVVDMHKHWVEAGGQSEHSILVEGLQPGSSFPLADYAGGPKNSKPKKARHPVTPKRSLIQIGSQIGCCRRKLILKSQSVDSRFSHTQIQNRIQNRWLQENVDLDSRLPACRHLNSSHIDM